MLKNGFLGLFLERPIRHRKFCQIRSLCCFKRAWKINLVHQKLKKVLKIFEKNLDPSLSSAKRFSRKALTLSLHKRTCCIRENYKISIPHQTLFCIIICIYRLYRTCRCVLRPASPLDLWSRG